MADSQQPVEQQVASQTQVEQQVTSQTPATKQKNPKRVAAGKAIARKTKEAREAQKRHLSRCRASLQPKLTHHLALQQPTHRPTLHRPKMF